MAVPLPISKTILSVAEGVIKSESSAQEEMEERLSQ
jgi:hypothetical protein